MKTKLFNTVVMVDPEGNRIWVFTPDEDLEEEVSDELKNKIKEK